MPVTGRSQPSQNTAQQQGPLQPSVANAGAVVSSKVSGTTVGPATLGVTFVTADLLVAHLAMDPSAGTVTFSAPGTGFGTTWTLINDQVNGSATSGVRTVVSFMACTAGGSLSPSVTATIPATTAKALRLYRINAAFGVPSFNSSASANGSAAIGTVAVTILTGGFDAMFVSFDGAEAATGATLAESGTPGTGWVSAGGDTTTGGTTGSTGATNISLGYWTWTKTGVAAGATSACGAGVASSNNAVVNAVFSNPTPPVLRLADLAMASMTGV